MKTSTETVEGMIIMVVVLQKKINMKRQLEVKLLLKKQIIFGWKINIFHMLGFIDFIVFIMGFDKDIVRLLYMNSIYQHTHEYNHTHTRTHTHTRNHTNKQFKQILYFLVGKKMYSIG
jgi:hypothetical protein